MMKRLGRLGCACMLLAATLWPADAAAQYRPVYPAHSHSTFVVSAGFGFGYPFYYPFYSPFYAPFYGSYWYPYYGAPFPGYYGPAWASARIEVKPNKAQVFLDGYYVGVVDSYDNVFQRLDVPTGAHELTVYLPGYKSYREKTLFRPGEGYHFKAVLEPLPAGTPEEPAPTPTAADPYAPPPDPRARQPYDQNPQEPRDPRDPRDPGRTRPLPERQGERRAPESHDFGTLNVRVQPIDAVVIIDGERWDSSEGGSRLVLELAAGSHRVEVRKEGFKTYTTTVQIRPGETQALNVSLTAGQL